MRRRTLVAVGGLLASVALTAVLWLVIGSPVFFLLVPFVPVLLGRRSSPATRRHCETCGFVTTEESSEYCPRDGRRLTVEADDPAEPGRNE